MIDIIIDIILKHLHRYFDIMNFLLVQSIKCPARLFLAIRAVCSLMLKPNHDLTQGSKY